MSSRRSSTDTTSLTTNLLRTYINDGLFSSLAASQGNKVMPIIRFVSYIDGVVRVLVGGVCPSCGVHHLRDTCNVRYCKEVVTPILKQRFDTIKGSIPVLHTDSDLESIALQNNINISTPHSSEKSLTFYEQQKFVVDFHPSIDGQWKGLSLKDCNDTVFQYSDNCTRSQLIEKYNVIWHVCDDTRITNEQGKQYVGPQEITANRTILPAGFQYVTGPTLIGGTGVSIVVSSKEFFTDQTYKVLSM